MRYCRIATTVTAPATVMRVGNPTKVRVRRGRARPADQARGGAGPATVTRPGCQPRRDVRAARDGQNRQPHQRCPSPLPRCRRRAASPAKYRNAWLFTAARSATSCVRMPPQHQLCTGIHGKRARSDPIGPVGTRRGAGRSHQPWPCTTAAPAGQRQRGVRNGRVPVCIPSKISTAGRPQGLLTHGRGADRRAGRIRQTGQPALPDTRGKHSRP